MWVETSRGYYRLRGSVRSARGECLSVAERATLSGRVVDCDSTSHSSRIGPPVGNQTGHRATVLSFSRGYRWMCDVNQTIMLSPELRSGSRTSIGVAVRPGARRPRTGGRDRQITEPGSFFDRSVCRIVQQCLQPLSSDWYYGILGQAPLSRSKKLELKMWGAQRIPECPYCLF